MTFGYPSCSQIQKDKPKEESFLQMLVWLGSP